MRFLCWLGIHWSGTTDGGSMQDAWTCDFCGYSKYPEVFSGWLIKKRTR